MLVEQNNLYHQQTMVSPNIRDTRGQNLFKNYQKDVFWGHLAHPGYLLQLVFVWRRASSFVWRSITMIPSCIYLEFFLKPSGLIDAICLFKASLATNTDCWTYGLTPSLPSRSSHYWQGQLSIHAFFFSKFS